MSGLIGQLLSGTYRVERLLGEGGMGVVYEASHSRLPRRFAIKVLHPHTARNAEAVARFYREAKVTSALGNSHIVDVIDVNETAEGTPFIVMELLSGESLEQRLARSPGPDLLEIQQILSQTASALQATHERGVVHRDLKPSNIFICAPEGDETTVKVLDFGISKVQGSGSVQTQQDHVLGTPAYMSPEQARGDNAALDHRTDIFALGVILYEMLAGQPPFAGQSPQSVLYQVVHQQPVPLPQRVPGIAPALVELVDRAMAKDPQHRFSSVQEFADALAALVTGGQEALPTGSALPSTPAAVPMGGDEAPTVAVNPLTSPGRRAETVPAARRRSVVGTGLVVTVLVILLLAAGVGTLTYHAVQPTPGSRPTIRHTPRADGSGELSLRVMGEREGDNPSRPPDARPWPPRSPDASSPDLTLAPDVTALLDLFSKNKQLRRMWLRSRPTSAEVWVNGRHLGRTPLSGVGLPRAALTLTLKKKGYRPGKVSLAAGKGQARPPLVRLKKLGRKVSRPAPAAAAALQLTTLADGKPTPANIYLDGEYIGQSALFRGGLKAGSHQIAAVKKGFAKASRKVRLKSGTNRVVLHLRRWRGQ